jgi:septum formation protein
LAPDIVPSSFEEDLSPSLFTDIHEYPVATATHKAVQVYERLVVSIGAVTSSDPGLTSL